MKVYKNYFYDANSDSFQILNTPYVLATEPVAIIDTEVKVKIPLVIPTNIGNIVVDRETYEKTHKRFYFNIKEDMSVEEIKEGNFQIMKWLPKDTDISKLRFINGDICLVEKEPKEKRDRSKEN